MLKTFFTRMAAGVLCAFAALSAVVSYGAMVDESAATKAAVRFLETGTGCSILPGRVLESMHAFGNLWVAELSPSGHILVSGSDHATPIIGFSENDFSEGEEDSPERAALDAADEAVATAEADETKGRHATWASILSETTAGTKSKARRLLASSGAGVNIEPFITSRYNQCQPWNDLTPVVSKDIDAHYRGRSLAGCVSVADAALVRAVRWPVYPARTDTVTHSFRGGTFDIRFDGSAPFRWDLMQDTYPDSGDLRGTLDEDKRYEIGHLLMWLNHSARMTYDAGVSTSTKYNSAHGGERDWYKIGRNMVPTAEGVEDIVTATLAAGIPVFVGVGGHAVVADGWKTVDDEAYVDLVYGWGGAGSWYSVETGPVKYFWVEHYPRAKPQLDPIPRVSGRDVTLFWHFPDCYADKLSGFLVSGKRRTSAALTTWTADFADKATGSAFPTNAWSTIQDGSTALYGDEGSRGVYQISTPLTITADSMLSLEVRGDASKDNISVEICGDDGNWRQLMVPAINWAYWNNCAYKESSCSLAAYEGQTVQLRIVKSDVLYNEETAIRNFKVTNVVPLSGGIVTPQIALATDRSVTLIGLDAGADYAFSVTPMFARETFVSAEPSDAKITTVEGTHAIPGTSTTSIDTYTTASTTIEFDGSRQITKDSELSFSWTANCVSDGSVTLYVYFTPTGGERESVYVVTKTYFEFGGNVFADQTGTYEETVSLEDYVGQNGTLEVVIVDVNSSIASSSAVSSALQVTNAGLAGIPETETLAALGMPEFTSIQYAANGNSAKDLTDGYLADGSIGSSTLYVTCSDAVTNLTATPSHLTLVSNETVHVSRLNDGRWRITFDPSIPENRNRQRQILTLHATDSNGTTIHRDIVMRMTADSGIEGGAEVDDDIMLYTPKARPIAVWNGDFNGATTRGAVTFNAQGNTIAEDGSTITKKAGEKGIDFAIADAGTSILGIAGGKNISQPSSGSAIIMATSSVSTNAATAVSWSDGGKFRLHEGAKSNQYYTAPDVVQIDSTLHSLGLLTTASGSKAYFDGLLATENSNPKLTSAVSGITLGGWRDSSSLEMANAAFSHIAIFTNATASADDVFNWNLSGMTGATTIPASGGALTSLDTGRNLGINLNGGRVTLDESVYAASLFVQDDTTLEVPMGFGISGSRVLYVAPGKTLTVDVICDASALSNAVSAAGGVYTSRILQGANYGDIVAGSLPDIGSRYTVELVQIDTEGVYFRVTDTHALNIYNDDGSDIPVGYVTDGGRSCIITNATGTITIPAMIEQVNVYAKDDALDFIVAAGASPTINIYASDANGNILIVSGNTPIPMPLALPNIIFSQSESSDGTSIALSLNPNAQYLGVKVRPELDTQSEEVTISDQPGMTVKTIPGLWYAIVTATELSEDSFAVISDSVQQATSATTSLSTSTKQEGDVRFYRVRVGASKAAVQQ